MFTNQALKSGQGDDSVKRFFVLVSSLFALREGCPVVPRTVADERELVSEIEMIDNQHHIIDMLRAIQLAVDSEAEKKQDKKGYYILQLNYNTHLLNKIYFRPSEIEKASMTYDYLESMRGNEPIDIVLVRASSFSTVKEAYPNYFMDIGEFVKLVEEYLK